ncbi:MAG: efflux RND transporter permease subunit [Thermoguttaceae bacterium]|jgi:Cu(I)/Ag(I) efflux system membrane protein CusA/SilA|nr:efflux RND transporter permease subunit [Thermoguttaceae bacterium]
MSEPNNQPDNHSGDAIDALVNGVIHFCMDNKLVVGLVLGSLLVVGLVVMPFDYAPDWLPRRRVPVDAIPDIGENQQIIFTEWMGRSPQDMEDQVTYPLTVSLLGVPGVQTVRSVSMFGFSSVYVIFEEGIDFYWSRARLIERLNAAQGDLPEGVVPRLGPDATALGQVFWYTLEGRDTATGEPTGGWDLDELRSIQDWNVRYALQAAGGIAEVASVGGFVREYQVDVDPDAMRAFGVTLDQVYNAVRRSNVDVGARTIEINRVEYLIRGLGFLKGVEDLEQTVVTAVDDVPVYLSNVAHITTGPALRAGALDKGGAEAVGGVVVVRHGENPLEAIENVKRKIDEIAPGLPEKQLADGRTSRVTIVPFYDRTELIYETLGTLERAIRQQILVTVIVVLVMVNHLRSSALISAMLPLAVVLCFIAMKLFGIDSNIMSLSGIAIAVGTVVDMGVILCENMLRHLEEADPAEDRRTVLFRAASEVGRPMLTAILTTVVSFLPVFAMTGPEGKLFRPLAYTKTFALLASVLVALTVVPPVAHLLFRSPPRRRWLRAAAAPALLAAGVLGGALFSWWIALALGLWAVYVLGRPYLPERVAVWLPRAGIALGIAVVGVVLTLDWMPLGIAGGLPRNFGFVILAVGGLLGAFLLFHKYYESVLRFFLDHKLVFYAMPATTTALAAVIWLGFEAVFGFIPQGLSRLGVSEERVRGSRPWVWAAHEFPGLGREFMPPLDEGSYLLMPTTMPHASIGEAMDVLRKQDMAISAIPEVDMVVGKIGRVESPLDPAPISMIETIITYKPEYKIDAAGRHLRFAYERRDGRTVFLRDEDGELIPDPRGMPYRQWREEIRSPDDIWEAIELAARLPGTTRAPKLQPISARIVMLQTGVRAPMAVRIRGTSLENIQEVGIQVERFLKEVPGVQAEAVIADRIIGKPYLEIDIDRAAIARYGINIRDVQDVIETAIGGRQITTTVEGRERYPVRVRYQRELRDTVESIEGILVAGRGGTQVPLRQLAEIRYLRGPQAIKGEDTMLVGYVLFDMRRGETAVDVVEAARDYLEEKLAAGELVLPPGTEMPTFIGEYQNQVRAARTLALVIPLALALIFIILYLQFRDVPHTLAIFSGVVVASSGGFILLYLYSVAWIGDIPIFGVEARELFQMGTFNMSVAVWVGFIALLGIATDDEVVMTSYLNQSFRELRTTTKREIREACVQAGLRRVRPCLMTTATTMLALLPVLTSTGRGSDVMVPMAIPSVGGMVLSVISLYIIPVTYSLIEETKLRVSTTSED